MVSCWVLATAETGFETPEAAPLERTHLMMVPVKIQEGCRGDNSLGTRRSFRKDVVALYRAGRR